MNNSDLEYVAFAQISSGMVYLVIALLATVFNVLYIIITLKRKRDKFTTDAITITLSVANIVLAYSVALEAFQVGFTTSISVTWISVVPQFAGIWQSLLILLVAVDCFFAIIKPLHYPTLITKHRVIICVISTGILSAIISVLILILPPPGNHVQNENSSAVLLFKDVYSPEIHALYKTWAVIRIAVSTLSSLIYIPVLKVIIQQIKQLNGQRRGSYRGFIVTTSLLVYHILSYLPINVIIFAPSINDLPIDAKALQIAFFFGCLLPNLSSVINPLLYGVATKSFW